MRVTPLTRRIMTICAALFFASQLLFLINIQFPRGHDFDEFHYVPSAKEFLALQENQNWEHPPLAKELMAVGIGLLGDRPIGWRYMSTVFGSLTLVGMFLWGFAVFRDEKSALWVALVTVANQLLYVQARIGMLDTFMFGFLVWGLASFTATWTAGMDPKLTRKLLAFSGLMFGLATACKWFGIVPWAALIGAFVVIRTLQSWKTSFAKEDGDDWYHPKLWSGVSWSQFALYMGLIPVVAYFITFLPFLWVHREPRYTLLDLIWMQKRMWEGQLRVVTPHPYMSRWTQWPFIGRPIWYAFDKEGPGNSLVRGVILIGNPLVMWSGMIALLLCFWGWITERSREAFLIAFFYAAFLGSWIVIPRKISFYYYYYPAGMTLSLALAYVFKRGEQERAEWKVARWVYLAAAAGVFVYFFPILAALRIHADSFRRWMWFTSWI